jgi:hypothetical protein
MHAELIAQMPPECGRHDAYRIEQSATHAQKANLGVASFLLPKVTVETPTISREFLIQRA